MIKPAFVSDTAFYIGDKGYAAVVTAETFDDGRFVINFDAIANLSLPIALTIDQDDIAACRNILGIGHPAPDYSQPIDHDELFDFRDFILDFASTSDFIDAIDAAALQQFATTARKLAHSIDAHLEAIAAASAAHLSNTPDPSN